MLTRENLIQLAMSWSRCNCENFAMIQSRDAGHRGRRGGRAVSAAGAGRQDREGVGGQKVISLDFRGSFSRGVLAQVENMSFAGKPFQVRGWRFEHSFEVLGCVFEDAGIAWRLECCCVLYIVFRP